MQKKFRNKLVFLLLVGMFLAFPSSGIDQAVSAAESGIILIGSKNFPVDSLSKSKIKDVFLAKKKQLDGQTIQFVILKRGDVHRSFLKEYVSKTYDQYNRYWKMQVFTGKGKPPKSFGSEKDLAAYVARTPNTIGYISSETTPENVRIIRIQ